MTADQSVTSVRCTEISKSFGASSIVRGLSIEVAQGEILALLGPSGCGKTTTLRLIAGFERPDAGSIEIAGRTVAGDGLFVQPEKRRIGVVFQDYAIFPHLSVAQNVAFGLGRGQEANRRVQEMIAFAGLEGQEHKTPDALSGGQQQRVALARALAPRPDVLLLDEPFSNLDASLRSDMRKEVRRLLKDSSATAIFVTHDQAEAMAVGDRLAVMHDGMLQQAGSPEEIFHTPNTRFVAEFMGHSDFVIGIVTEEGVETSLGLLPQKPRLPKGTLLDVLVRPDDLLIGGIHLNGRQNGGESNNIAEVAEREFVGIANIYRLRLPGGETVCSWADHTTVLEEGARVRVDITDRHALTCFHNNVRVKEWYRP